MSSTSDLTKYLFMASDYYKENLSEGVINFWLAGLSEFSTEEVSFAFGKWMRSSDRMPKISNIVEIIKGSGEDLALAALIKVENAMSRYGSYATVVFDDPIIHAVIPELGGWVRTCRLTENEFTWWKKDFRERYQHHLRYGTLTNLPPKLLGIYDEKNLLFGEKPQKPAVIGDYEKAIGWVSKLSNPESLSWLRKDAPERIAGPVKDGI
jgi:hypothetical protein